MSVVSNSSVEVDSDSSNDVSSKDDNSAERKFILRNELYNSLLASALGKTVLNRHLNFKEQGINFNLANLKDNLNALGALKELKDLKDLTVSSVPAFPRNLALRREDHDEVRLEIFGNFLHCNKYWSVIVSQHCCPGEGNMRFLFDVALAFCMCSFSVLWIYTSIIFY